jgi:hypothetical protein
MLLDEMTDTENGKLFEKMLYETMYIDLLILLLE